MVIIKIKNSILVISLVCACHVLYGMNSNRESISSVSEAKGNYESNYSSTKSLIPYLTYLKTTNGTYDFAISSETCLINNDMVESEMAQGMVEQKIPDKVVSLQESRL